MDQTMNGQTMSDQTMTIKQLNHETTTIPVTWPPPSYGSSSDPSAPASCRYIKI